MRNAKDVTRRRLYLEAMQDVLPKLGKTYVIDPEEQGGLLPLLNLDEKLQEEKKPMKNTTAHRLLSCCWLCFYSAGCSTR
ncbi:MAG: hypothetical protein MZU91_06670 [Desulfosudis oleivorans]|nr:hypothetical protein [Desulfosudis oleivorans]